MPIDEKRIAELKNEELQKFSGQTKVTTEKHTIYAVTIDLANPDAPRAVIHSRNEVTPPSGIVIHGESEQTISLLDPTAPPFQKATPRGGLTGEMDTIGDMIATLAGFSIDAVANRKARERAEKEDAENPHPDQDLEG